MTNRFLKLNNWHKYAVTGIHLGGKADKIQTNVTGAIEKLTALEKQTRQVSCLECLLAVC